MANRFAPPRRPAFAEHGIVYRHDGEFTSHPFYCGLWRVASGDLVTAFMRTAASYATPEDVHHNRLMVADRWMTTIRSRNNGESWDAGTMMPVTGTDPARPAEDSHGYADEPPLDFADPDVLVVCGSSPALFVPEAHAWLRASTDGGQSWRRPIKLPMSRLPSLTGHGGVAVRADGMALLPLTTVSADGWTRRPLLYASPDGRHWTFLSFVTPSADDGAADSDRSGHPRFGAHRYLYPRALVLRDGRVILTIRCQRDPTAILWTEMFESEDGGRTWRFLSRVNDWGAPGDIVELADGRIVCVYGYRLPPYGVRARVSEDGGRTWGPELILRDDGGSWDLGYPKVIERRPGEVLAVYYINLRDDAIQMNGGVRHIARTIFRPD